MTVLNTIVEQAPVLHYVITSLCSIFCVVAIIGMVTKHKIFTIAIGVFFTLLFLFVGLIEEQKYPITRYEVTIDKGADIKDVLSQYDLVEQRGEIFVLEPKGE